MDTASVPGRLAERLRNSLVYKYFSSVPQQVEPADYWFFSISNLAYTLILLLHFSWMLVFLRMGIAHMAAVQLLSISIYALANICNRSGLLLVGMVIALTEVNIHQFVAVAYLGWDSGFQNFIPLIGLMPFLKYNSSWSVKIPLALSGVACYLGTDYFLRNATPLAMIDASQLTFFTYSNAVLCFILAALWGIVLAVAYQRAVTALMRKEQELFASENAAQRAEAARVLEVQQRDNEIFQLRYVELKKSSDDVIRQKQIIEKLVAEQEEIIKQRTNDLAIANTQLTEGNKKLIELIQYNAHNVREPLARILGVVNIMEYVTKDEFTEEIWPQIGKAVTDLDTNIRKVITAAEETIEIG